MIAKLYGKVDALGEDHLVLDVNGVGYLVFASARTLRALSVGKPASLIIETHVREDHIHLYGFAVPVEKQWFGLLTTVQGVGAKVALALLSALSPDELMMAIAAQDVTALCRAQGVGKKVGQRIAGELKDKAPMPGAAAPAKDKARAPEPVTAMAEAQQSRAPIDDAVSALVNLGYGRSDAFVAVGRAARQDGEVNSLDGLIRAALKELSK